MVTFYIDEMTHPYVNIEKLGRFWPANLQSVTLYTLSGKTFWHADATKIPDLPTTGSTMLILEATWNGHQKSRQRYFPKQW